MEELRTIIAGGGTGGHIFPAVAVGHAIKRLLPDSVLLFVGAKGKMEMEKVPKEGFEIIGLDIAGFNRSNLLSNISLPFKLIKCNIEAKKIIKKFRPHIIVGVGGYASFPMLNAANSCGIATVILEQNSFAGKSNKILGRKARLVCVAYEKMERFFPKEKLLIAGNPVRKNIAHSTVTGHDGKKIFGLDTQRKTILVIGGSQGAKSVNECVYEHLDEIIQGSVQMIWQTGDAYFESATKRIALNRDRVKVLPFIGNMEYAYAAADIIISRAGALAISELCIVGKPVIFIPFPFAAEDHQTENAMSLVEKNAAMIIKDSEIGTKLASTIKSLLNDEEKQRNLSINIKKLAVYNADETIAGKIIELAKVA